MYTCVSFSISGFAMQLVELKFFWIMSAIDLFCSWFDQACTLVKKKIFCRFRSRYDLTEELKQLQCTTLMFVGENSEFHAEAVHMTSKLERRYCALAEFQACGSLVTEEKPHVILIPMEYLFMGYDPCSPPQLVLYIPRAPFALRAWE